MVRSEVYEIIGQANRASSLKNIMLYKTDILYMPTSDTVFLYCKSIVYSKNVVDFNIRHINAEWAAVSCTDKMLLVLFLFIFIFFVFLLNK